VFSFTLATFLSSSRTTEGMLLCPVVCIAIVYVASDVRCPLYDAGLDFLFLFAE